MEIKTEYEPEFGPTEMVFETVDIPSSSKKIAKWSNTDTRLLMDFHKNLLKEVGPKKRFLHKKDMWLEISSKIPNKTPKQCEERYKTVLKRKKKGKEKVYLSEARRKTIDLEAKYCVENTFEIVRKHPIDSEMDDNSAPFKRVFIWTNSETKLLMSLYRTLIWEVGKRFVYQKEMWAEIATHFPEKTANQCEQRYKTVLRRKTKGFITKAKRKPVDIKARDCVESVENKEIKVLITEKKEDTITQENDEATIVNNDESITQDYKEPHTRQEKKELTLHEILLQIAAKKEEAKERRHREKMEATKQLQNILQQILSSQNN
ncbi:myb-related protein B-like [Calliphora vicina]|uniref:myb-related protein B-like n=1 Tax=Calliphora vicina TaxID=7373 RepID=UPI00325B9A4E